MVEQKLEQIFGLFDLVSNDAFGEALIDIKSLFTRNRVLAYNRML